MKRNKVVNPLTLKGREVQNRMIELMGATINESTNNYVIELTKLGPDNKSYAIVRENHTYFIKVSDKTSGLLAEDFQYMGGLKNKHDEAYPSYSKALNRLNLKFISLSETYGTPAVSVFKNDYLLVENAEVVEEMIDVQDEDECVVEDIDETIEMSENESEIDSMITNEPVKDIYESEGFLVNRRLKIGKAIRIHENDDRLDSIVQSLSESDIEEINNRLKKKV